MSPRVVNARRQRILAMFLAAAAGAPFAAHAALTASGCTSISSVPPTFSGIQYGAAIQGMFDDFTGMNNGCTDCHFPPPPQPSGDLDLGDGVSWGHLVNVQSAEDATLTYVVPGHPEQSLLFAKIDCDTPPVGARMPYGYPSDTLTPEQIALVWDWIAAGAPVTPTDGVFRDGFDLRGLTP